MIRTVILVIILVILTVCGALTKLMHWPYANAVLGSTCESIPQTYSA